MTRTSGRGEGDEEGEGGDALKTGSRALVEEESRTNYWHGHYCCSCGAAVSTGTQLCVEGTTWRETKALVAIGSDLGSAGLWPEWKRTRIEEKSGEEDQGEQPWMNRARTSVHRNLVDRPRSGDSRTTGDAVEEDERGAGAGADAGTGAGAGAGPGSGDADGDYDDDDVVARESRAGEERAGTPRRWTRGWIDSLCAVCGYSGGAGGGQLQLKEGREGGK